MTTYKVGYFVGSLSSVSINRLLAKALVRLAPAELEMVEIPLGQSSVREELVRARSFCATS